MEKALIKNIIFDLGNTLIFFDYSRFFNGVSSYHPHLPDDLVLNYFRDNRLDIHIGKGRMTVKDAFRDLKKRHDLSISFSDFHDLYRDIFWENTDMKNLIEQKLLSSGLNLFMLSNVDASHINYINKKYPFVNHIKKRVLSYKVDSIKPEKKIYRHLIKEMKIIPEESVFIDDLKQNIAAAEELGINGIHYTSHKKFLKEFSRLTGIK